MSKKVKRSSRLRTEKIRSTIAGLIVDEKYKQHLAKKRKFREFVLREQTNKKKA